MKMVRLLFFKKTALSALLRAVTVSSAVAIGVGGILTTAEADEVSRNQAKRMHDRLLGVPPTEAALTKMEGLIDGGDAEGAATWAINQADPAPNSRVSSFYNVSLKNFFVPYTNEEASKYQPLNDAAATMIGMVRDDIPFDQVLYGNILYVGAAGAASSTYSTTNNDHYEQLESNQADLSDSTVLVSTSQSAINNGTQSLGSTLTTLNGSANYAGVVTTRAFGEAYFKAGTNRRMWRFTSMNFLCRDLEDVKDITRIPDRIRQDVSRSPGGDSSIFLNSCIGCHSGMDPMASAYAFYEWVEDANDENGHVTFNNIITHNPRPADISVTPTKHKYLINSGNFVQGYITVDDNWENYWREGPNAALGWGRGQLSNAGGEQPPIGSTNTGSGPTSLGKEVASSEAFAMCQVERVYEHVCLEKPTAVHEANLHIIKNEFMNGYNLKTVFAKTATLCMGN